MTDIDPVRRTEQPEDRLGRIAAAMLTAAETHPEATETDRVVIMLNDEHKGMSSLGGYDSDLDAMADMFMHLRAIARANGRDLQFIGIPNDASGLDG